MQTGANSKVPLAEGVCFLNGKIVLVRHKKLGWTIPGGHVEEGERIIDALRREIMEETGLRVVWAKEVMVDKYKQHDAHIFVCLCEGELQTDDPDIQEVSLFEINTALCVVPEWQRPFLEQALKTLKNLRAHEDSVPR